ncbi:hypothetical protein PoB_004822000 [Plakobranchus ocellatus]|uniref:Uncharacterized protein n=1 Tax=Plakobranchus ocellatus TaxID=259542 RepID=A0AAV4BMF7_9GAST|nr:hypothetical protein PoB_004822000 [Plakobranchus ocellatus]
MPDNTATEHSEFLQVPETSQNSESEVQPAQPLQVPTDSNPSSSTMRGVPGSPSLPYVTRSGRAVIKPSRYPPQDGTYLARVRVGAMDPESSEWIFPDFKVITKTEDDILTLKVNVTDPVTKLLIALDFLFVRG